MSGSGHSPKIAEKLLSELRAAFALWRKELRCLPLDVSISPALTVFSTQISCEALGGSFQWTKPMTHEVGLREIQPACHQTLLVVPQAAVADAQACHMEPVICEEAVFSQQDLNSHQVIFDGLQLNSTEVLPTEYSIEPSVSSLPVFKSSVRAKEQPIPTWATSTAHKDVARFKITSRKTPRRFLTLPIKRVMLPLHRLSGVLRERFKKALAEKAQTSPSNVLIKVVYDRMNMNLYQGISQDEKGVLFCTPKDELVGMSQEQNIRKGIGNPSSYLVFGMRLDTKEAFHTLVPMENVERKAP